MRKTLLFLLPVLLLLTACGKLPETGPFGTIASATQAVEQDGVLYFIYPVGPVYEPAGVAAYDVEQEEFWQIPDPLEDEILGIQVDENNLYTLTESAVYRSGLDGMDWTLLCQTEEDVWNRWFFLLKDRIYLCRERQVESDHDVESWSEIVWISVKNGRETRIAEIEGWNFIFPSVLCYWDGAIYSRYANEFQDVLALDLKSGQVTTAYSDEVLRGYSGIYADRQGIVLKVTTEDGEKQRRLNGEEMPLGGSFLGSNGDKSIFQQIKYQRSSISILEGTEQTVLVEPYEWDMVTEPDAMTAGSYVLFYTREDLTGDGAPEDREDLVHYLYLVDRGGNLRKIGSYTQDFWYS